MFIVYTLYKDIIKCWSYFSLLYILISYSFYTQYFIPLNLPPLLLRFPPPLSSIRTTSLFSVSVGWFLYYNIRSSYFLYSTYKWTISETVFVFLWLISLSKTHPPGPSMLLQHLLNGLNFKQGLSDQRMIKLINPESKFFEKANKGVWKRRVRRQGTKLGAQGPFESLMCADCYFGCFKKK